MLAQKSRAKWIKEGNTISHFFHASLKDRYIKNYLVGLHTENGGEVKDVVVHHFQRIFMEPNLERPFLSGIQFNQVSSCDCVSLTVLKKDVVGRCSPKGCDFLLKKIVPNLYWNIDQSLLLVVCTRLFRSLWFGSVISPCQIAFLPGNSILDDVMVTNELIDLVQKGQKSCFLFKIDFEKTYDSVSSMSVLVNDSPTGEFVAQRGLKQGTLLFFMVAEGLSGLVGKAHI